jgi:hypothetical protein
MRKLLLLIGVLAVIAVAAGCGGDSGDSSSNNDPNVPVAAPGVGDAPPGSKKGYIAQADITCSELNAKIQKLPQPKTPKDLGPLYRKIAGWAEDFYAKFAAIPKPAEGRALLDTYQQNLKNNIALTKQVAGIVEKNQAKALPGLVKRVQRIQRRNLRIAKRYGFKICGGV